MRNSDRPPQVENEIEEGVEATHKPKIARKPGNLVVDGGAVEDEYVGHEHGVRHAVMSVVQGSHRMREGVDGAESFLESGAPHECGRHHVGARLDVPAVLHRAGEALL